MIRLVFLVLLALAVVAGLNTLSAQCRTCGPQYSAPVYWQPGPSWGVQSVPLGAPPVMSDPTPTPRITVKDLSTAKPEADNMSDPKEGPFNRIQNFGVDLDKIGKDGPCYKINGQPCSRDMALQAITNTIPNDANNMRLTIFGTPQAQQQLMAVIGNALSDPALKDKWTVQKYGPDSWIVKQYGFVVDPVQPTLYMQSPTGEVLHRSVGVPEPQQLATALRRADPSYDPTKDPDLLKNPQPSNPDITGGALAQLLAFIKQNGFLLMVGGIALLLMYGKKGD